MTFLLLALAVQNPVDAYFDQWWKDNEVEAAPRADDYAFLRRASLDVGESANARSSAATAWT